MILILKIVCGELSKVLLSNKTFSIRLLILIIIIIIIIIITRGSK